MSYALAALMRLVEEASSEKMLGSRWIPAGALLISSKAGLSRKLSSLMTVDEVEPERSKCRPLPSLLLASCSRLVIMAGLTLLTFMLSRWLDRLTLVFLARRH